MRFLLAFILVVCVSARTTWRELNDYTFEKYVREFKFKWEADSEEYQRRKSIFEIELARVKKHNAAGFTWKEGVNQFSALTADEKRAYHGYNKGLARVQKLKTVLPSDLQMKPVSELPPSIDWRTKSVVSPVKDQGACGSCWAFAATAVIESHVALNSGLLFDLSPQQITSCTPNPNKCGGNGGCAGATCELAFDYVAGTTTGILQEFQYSYSSYYGNTGVCQVPSGGVATVGGYVKLPENNYTALMNAIATVGPIAISVEAQWGGYEEGVFNGCTDANTDINHAVVLVGYGEQDGQKYWLVRNSWSPSWGEAGYIKLLRSDSDDENCSMDNTPLDGSACEGQTDPVKVCGTCGVLYDTSYPTGARVL